MALYHHHSPQRLSKSDLFRIPKEKGEELPPAVVMKLDVEGKVGRITLIMIYDDIYTRSLGPRWAPIYSWWPLTSSFAPSGTHAV